MSDTNTATSGAKTDSSGSVDSKSSTSGDETKNPDKHIEKLLKEKENWKTKALTLEANLNEVKESELKAKENYKALYESAKTSADLAKKELETFKEKDKAVKINGAIIRELYKFGLAQEHAETALKLFDRGTVNLDPDTQVVVGAEEAAKAFHEKHSSLNFWKKSGAGVNQNGAGNSNTQFGRRDFSKMSKDELWKAYADTVKKQ